ncbi:SRPBCC family protein [Microdochium nivale]|nr:SRPBCC family protein [Microdochium nivale]
MKLTTAAFFPILLASASAAATGPSHPPHHNDDLLGDFDWGTLRCSSPDNINGTLPTPTYGFKNRLWMICTELTIRAPPSFVYDALVDFDRYSRWNTFVTRVYGYPANVTVTPRDVYVGMQMTFAVAGMLGDLDPGVTQSVEAVTVLQREARAGSRFRMNAWRSDTYFDAAFVVAEHPNILTGVKGRKKGEQWTRYISYETYYDDPVSQVIRAYQERLQVLFDRQGAQLKQYVEGKWQGQWQQTL